MDEQQAPEPPAVPTPPLVPPGSGPFLISAALSAIFAVRLLGSSWYTHFPAVWPDAVYPKESYLAVAGVGPFHPSFYFAFRPIGYPLFLWFFGRSSHLVVVAQTLLFCIVVSALCITAWRVLRSRVVAAITIVVLIGVLIQAKYAMWDMQILSESIGISLGIAAIAVWWRFAASPTRAKAIWGTVLVVCWMVSRDAHVLTGTVVLASALASSAWLARRLDANVRRALAGGAIAIVIAAGYSFVAESSSHRARLSFHNFVGIRVLPDRELTRWFAARGMPLDAALRTRTGKGGLSDNFYLSKDPAFAKYRNWVDGAGRRDVLLSLALEAPHYRDLMYKDLPSILQGDVSYYDTQGAYSRLPHAMPLQLGGPTTRKGLTAWLLLALAALGASALVAWRRRRGYGIVVFSGVVLLLPLVEMYTTWAGDPVEMQRHLIGALSRLSIALVIVIAIGVDALVGMWSTVPAIDDTDTDDTETDASEAEASEIDA